MRESLNRCAVAENLRRQRIRPGQGCSRKIMLIVCPSCASQYELDAAKLGPSGRKVRCAKCETLWHVERQAEAPAFPEAPSGDETTALLDEELRRAAEIDEQVSALAAERAASAETATAAPMSGVHTGRPAHKQARPAPRPFGERLRRAAPMTLAIGGLAVLGLLAWKRDAAVRTAPQLAMIFEKIGLPVNVRGLALTGIESGLVQDAQGRFLVVEGDITNIAKSATRVPPIEVAVRDAAGQTLYSWETDPPRAKLEPAELVRFRARLASPPDSGQSVLVRFSAAKPTGIASAR